MKGFSKNERCLLTKKNETQDTNQHDKKRRTYSLCIFFSTVWTKKESLRLMTQLLYRDFTGICYSCFLSYVSYIFCPDIFEKVNV